MYIFVLTFLALYVLLGVGGMFVALKHPRAGATSLEGKLSQGTFRRGYISASMGVVCLGLLLSGVFDPREALVIGVGVPLLFEGAAVVRRARGLK
jgi:hypothetical protein